VSGNFTTVVVADFEFETSGGDYNLRLGDMPMPLCMVAHVLNENLQHMRTIRMWRGEFGKAPPFDIGSDALFVAYSAQAEMMCFLALGWQFPAHIFDQHTAYLAATNILLPYNPEEKRKRERKRLSDACRRYGIGGWENISKEEIAKDIGEGRWREYGREVVFDYCEEDVRMSVRLLRAQLLARCGAFGRILLPAADVERVLHWSNYSAKTVAQIQARGMPIDVELWDLVQENKAAVIRALRRRFDPSYDSDDPIYDENGKFEYDRFERYLVRIGVTAWPRLESGALDLDSDTWRLMSYIPGIDGVHALRDSLRVIASATLPIGRDGRNRPSLFPFGTATGRNAHTRSLYNAHAGLRSFMVFPQDKIGVYLDWRTQEVGVAAARSGDPALIEAYRSGDVYHALAVLCGLTNEPDPIRWKRECREMRDRVKPLQLGINYGMGVKSLAAGLGRHPVIASDFIERHKRRYPRFWWWRDNQAMTAMLDRRTESVFGWPLRISTSPNKRTLYNFPMQSDGAEMLRIAAWRLCEAGIVPCMLVHDGILIEARDPQEIQAAMEIMRQAGRDVCGGLEVGVDIDQELRNGARYQDKRPMAKQMWDTIMSALQEIGAATPKLERKAS
jgi:DNA polymerase I